MKLRVLLPLTAVALVMSCDPSTSRVADCAGGCVAVPGTGGGDGASGLPCDVAGVLAAKCITCHGTTPSGGAPNSLVTRDDLIRASNLGGTIASRCATRLQDAQSPMPPRSTGDSASASDIAAITGWVNAGLPGGACASAGQAASGGGAGGGGGTGGGTATGGGGGATGGGGGTTSSAYCRACSSDTTCGGTNNFCLGFSFGDFCGSDCSTTGTCVTGQRCANIIDNTTMAVMGRNCVPVTGATCTGTGGGGGATGGGGGTQCTTDTWANYGASFFASSCTRCHQQFATKSVVVSYKLSISSRISSGSMPPGGLTSADKTRILHYLSCGVP